MAADDPKVTPLRKPRPCPECGKPSQRATFPFCSVRCKNIDLNRWLTGSYAIPGPPADEDGVERGPDDGNDGGDDSRG